jgi:hypothetical protein
MNNNNFKKTFLKKNLYSRLLTMYFNYKHNSLLHNYISQIIISIIKSDDMDLKKALFLDCHLVESIVQHHNDEKEKNVSYLSFLYNISNIIISVSSEKRNVFILDTINNVTGWESFVTDFLSGHNNLTSKELCGPKPIGGIDNWNQNENSTSNTASLFTDFEDLKSDVIESVSSNNESGGLHTLQFSNDNDEDDDLI